MGHFDRNDIIGHPVFIEFRVIFFTSSGVFVIIGPHTVLAITISTY